MVQSGSSDQGQAILAALLAILISIAVVCGWLFDVHVLKSFLPGAIGMKLVTATAFCLAAAAVMLLASPRAARIAVLPAFVVSVLGSLSLIQEFTGRDLRIDRMWVAEAPGSVETVYPGRMAANAAVCFVALGVALVVARRSTRGASLLARSCLFVVALVSLQVLIGFAFDAKPLRSSSWETPMALPTAINFALLTFAVASLRKNEWPMSLLANKAPAGAAARGLLAAGIVITLVTGWLRLYGQDQGWYETKTGTALYALANILALSAAILFAASRLQRIEVDRMKDREGLARAFAAQDVISVTSREIEIVENVIAAESRRLTDAEGTVIVVPNGASVRYRCAAGSATVLEGLSMPAEQGGLGTIRQAGGAIIEDISLDGRVEPEVRKRMGKVAAAVLPLHDGESFVGSILIFAASEKRIEPRQMDLLRIIGNASAAALSQAWQLEVGRHMLREQAGEMAVLQEQFTAFMNNIPVAAFIKDQSGRYLYANPSISRFLGRELEAVLGSSDEEILSPSHLRSLQYDEKEPGEEGDRPSQVVHFDERGEDAYWLLMRFAIRIEGRPALQGGVAVDISEQRRFQEEIAQLNASLEKRVGVRTAELERANAELEAFTYTVSHDLRAPLRAVSGYSSILQEDHSANMDAEARRFLATICSEAKRMGDLIDDLLSFSRLGRQSIAPREVDVARMARESFTEIQRDHPGRKLELICDDLPLALADPVVMRHVLINLLSNAAKYAKKEGTIRIEIGATTGEEFHTYRVRDWGVGFDMRYADKLFGVFQRLHSAEEFEGTGVGLAIVERIVTRHGGRVWAEGATGEGASFYFTLPVPGSARDNEESLSGSSRKEG